MFKWLRLILQMFAMWLALSMASAVHAQSLDAPTLEAIRAADLQLATDGFRLSTANAALCDRLEPGLGIQIHTLDQYAPAQRAGVRAHFGFVGAVAVEGVVPGSPAARAGVRADDNLVSIGGIQIAPQGDVPASTDRLVGLWNQLASLPPTAPIRAELIRAGARIDIVIDPVPACRTRYELTIDPGLDASANGDMVRISSGYYDRFGAELVVAALAHELAHNILRHRDRLKAVGAEFGLLSGFGRNADLFRQTELQADTLAVHLMARAGYPADTASRFRQHPTAKAASGVFQAKSHPHWKVRLRIARAQEAQIAASGPGAPFVAERDTVLTGDWRPLVPKN